ncbi:unnamed protein product, partial [Rhizoctonia solani]
WVKDVGNSRFRAAFSFFEAPHCSTLLLPRLAYNVLPQGSWAMSFHTSFIPLSSSVNPALAWSLGNGGKGYIVINFPFTLNDGWYCEQPCTKFRTFQHRKERKGLRHEFIVLKLNNGRVCRVERMGDPNARLNALMTRGSVAQDLAQCFDSEDEAHLKTSELVTEVTLPCDFEILDVLKICRAIKEGEKTSSYTLQVYNCYFFSLAIQACLTRFVAHWEDKQRFEVWLSQVKEAVEEWTRTDQVVEASISSPHYNVLFRILSVLDSDDNQEPSLMCAIKLRLQPQLTAIQQDVDYRVNNLLWYSTIGSSLNEFIEEKAKKVVLDILQERLSKKPTSVTENQPGDTPPNQPEDTPPKPSRLKQKLVYQPSHPTIKFPPTTNPLPNSMETTYAKPTQAIASADISVNWLWHKKQQAISLTPGIVNLFLRVLHIALLGIWGIALFTFEIDNIPCVDVEQRLKDILADLERLGGMKRPDPKSIIKKIHASIADQRAVWDNSPWYSIHVRGNILESLEESKPRVEARYGQEEVKFIPVSIFQKRIIKRIQIQANEVESYWLGSAKDIQVELLETLSQVWKMIREDAGINEKVAVMGRSDLSSGLSSLGASHRDRFGRLGELNDLEKSMEYYSRALASTPNGHPDLSTRHADLGVAYRNRFRRLGEMNDLQKSIEQFSRALELTPEGHPDLSQRHVDLGTAMLLRFRRLDEMNDLERSMEHHSRALELTPDGHPNLSTRYADLGVAYRDRYQRLDEMSDLERSMELHSRALLLTPDGHPDLSQRCADLGTAKLLRFQRSGELHALTESIEQLSRALGLTPDGHPDLSTRHADIGVAYGNRSRRLGEMNDLERSMEHHFRALELTPDGHPDLSTRHADLGVAYRDRYQRLGEMNDLERSMELHSRALKLTPDDHPDLSTRHADLGVAYRDRYQRLGEMNDLEKSMEHHSRALEWTPDDHPGLSTRYFNWALSHLDHYRHAGDPSSLQRSLGAFRRASRVPTSPPRAKFQYALRWAALASENSSLQCIEAYQTAIDLLPQFIWLGATTIERYRNLSTAENLAADATYAAILDSSPILALEWVERARCVVWNQSLMLRSPLDRLHSSHPDLAARLQVVSEQLHNASLESSTPRSFILSTVDLEQVGQHRRRLAMEYNDLLGLVHQLHGFEDFLQPMKADALVHAARNGPIVVINCHKDRCDALLILPGEGNVEHIPLPSINGVKIQRIRLEFETSIEGANSGGISAKGVLAVLWHDIVQPVLDFLGYINNAPTDSLPHITWCPTGALSRLPLHAAGDYDQPHARVFNYAISSYTPSLTALLSSAPSVLSRGSRVLAIGQPHTRGHSALPGVVNELAFIKAHTQDKVQYSQLCDDQATTATVLDAMEQHDWVHFACHAHQNVTDPTKSGFFLHDGALDLAAISLRPFKNKGLAFLSAVQTAMGEEKLPDEAVHLAAGMLVAGYTSVIAIIWNVRDEDAPFVADKVYAELMKEGKVGNGEAGKALHYAVAELRDSVGEEEFGRWVPFIHIGS